MKMLNTHALAAAASLALMGLAGTTANAQERSHWYAQGQGGFAFPTTSTLSTSLGAGVNLTGETRFGSSNVYSLAFGRQFQRAPDAKGGESAPWRLEGEWWSASLDRERVRLGALTLNPNDSVRARVLFINALASGWQSAEKSTGGQPLWRTWGGLGLGYGKLSYPDAAVLSGCNCLAASSSSGTAWQAKVVVERQFTPAAIGFLQMAWVQLPAASSAGSQFPQTRYGKTDLTHALTVGVRASFN